MEKLEWANNYFMNDIFATETTGIEIVKAGHNYCMCKLNISSKHCNANDFVMGGVLYTLADFTFAVAANQPDKKVVTSNSYINFLVPVKSSILFSESELIREGHNISVFNVRITDENKKEVVFCTFNGVKVLSKNS